MHSGKNRVLGLFVLTALLGLSTRCGVLHAQTVAALSELEQTQLQVLKLQTAVAQLEAAYNGCKADVGQLYASLGTARATLSSEQIAALEATLKAAIERNHPGYTVDVKTGALTKQVQP